VPEVLELEELDDEEEEEEEEEATVDEALDEAALEEEEDSALEALDWLEAPPDPPEFAPLDAPPVPVVAPASRLDLSGSTP